MPCGLKNVLPAARCSPPTAPNRQSAMPVSPHPDPLPCVPAHASPAALLSSAAHVPDIVPSAALSGGRRRKKSIIPPVSRGTWETSITARSAAESMSSAPACRSIVPTALQAPSAKSTVHSPTVGTPNTITALGVGKSPAAVLKFVPSAARR